MIKKEIGIGFLIGIISNCAGMLFYILIFSEYALWRTLRQAFGNEFLGTLIAAGAILNFLPFFFFLNRKRIYRARGVLLASIFAALCIATIKFL